MAILLGSALGTYSYFSFKNFECNDIAGTSSVCGLPIHLTLLVIIGLTLIIYGFIKRK